MKLTAKAEYREVYILENKWGSLLPIRTLSIAEAAEFYTDLGVALRDARKEDLEAKKSRLAVLQQEVRRLERETLQ